MFGFVKGEFRHISDSLLVPQLWPNVKGWRETSEVKLEEKH
jgi:hypothetical protein